MKAPFFAYVRPHALLEALDAPEILVDLAGLDDLKVISVKRNLIRGMHVGLTACRNRRIVAHRPC